MFKKVAFLAVAGAALASNGAIAATATSNMTVQAVITGSCTVTAPTMNFGNILLTTANTDTQTDLTVNCTNAVPYTVGIDGTVGARTLTNGAQTLSYEIYTDNTFAVPVDNPGGLNVIPGTGTGANQTVSIFGRVPVQTTPPAGTYTRTAVVTVTY